MARKASTTNSLHGTEYDATKAMNLVRSINPVSMVVDQDRNFTYDSGIVSVSGGGAWIEAEYMWSKSGKVPVVCPTVPVVEDSARWSEFFRISHIIGLNEPSIGPVMFSGSAAMFPTRRGVVFCEFPIPSLAAATGDEYTAIPLAAVRALSYAHHIFRNVEGEASIEAGVGEDGDFTITVRGRKGFLSVTHPVITKKWLSDDSAAEAQRLCMTVADSTLTTTGASLYGAARGSVLTRFRDSTAGKNDALRQIDNGFGEGHVMLIPTGDTTHLASTNQLVFGERVTLHDSGMDVVKLPVIDGAIDRSLVVNGPAFYAAASVAGGRDVRIGATDTVVTFDLPNEIRLIAPKGTLEPEVDR